MSDSSNSFGEALESMTTNTKQAVGGTIADFGKSIKNQTTGSNGMSGSFTPGKSTPQVGGQNPQPEAGKQILQGGDLFSPDMKGAQKPTQNPSAPKPLSQAGQAAAQNPDAKTPEEMEKIQKIEQEIRSMHQEYYQDFESKTHGRDRKTVEENQAKAQTTQKEEAIDLQKKEEKKATDDQALQRAQRATEVKGGLG